MVGILEVGKMAFESYRKDIVAAIIFGLVSILVGIISVIPIIGAIIEAYIRPRVLEWYYNKTIGNIKSDHKLTFKIWLVWLLAIHIIFLFFLLILGIRLSILFTGVTLTTLNLAIRDFLIFLLVGSILSILVGLIFYYPAYASILGKINKIEINDRIIKNSLILILYAFVWSIILAVIMSILGAIPVVGGILALIYILFVFNPILNLIIAHKALSM
ncbi:MAG: hypothetical protein QXQ16_02885 [Candidatus Aenigmatarchaeota archaeon]